MSAKAKLLVTLCIALLFTLCACAQSQVNSDRIHSNDNAEATDPSGEDGTYGESGYTMGEYVEAGKVFEINNFDGSGAGHVNFYVNDVKMADDMEGAGIDSAKYQLSGSHTYDYYVAISLTIENVDVPVDVIDSEFVRFPFISHFRMRIGDDIAIEPAYFDQGGVADPDPKRYFQYELPGIEETLDVVIAYGLTDKGKNKPLFLSYDYVSGMMPIEGVF